jgi:hypothetical protein
MWGSWYGLLANIIFSGLCFGLLENGQIGASKKTDNDVLLAQTIGHFILEVDDLFPANKASQFKKESSCIKTAHSITVKSFKKTSVKKIKFLRKAKPKNPSTCVFSFLSCKKRALFLHLL